MSEQIAVQSKSKSWFGGVLLLLLKGGKLFKFILAVLSLAAYSWMLTWQVAIVFLFGLVCHEYGHVWAMRKCGIPTKGFYLIPFVGGFCAPERPWDKRAEEAFIASMGPVFGLAVAPLCLLLGWLVSGNLEQAVHATNLIVLVNLFNLLPIVPLDGGRIIRASVASLNRKLAIAMIVVGVGGALYLAYQLESFILFYVALIACLEAWSEWRMGHHLKPMSLGSAVAWITAWLGLAIAAILIIFAMGSLIDDHTLLDMIKNI